MLKCKKCCGHVHQYEHVDEMLKFETNKEGFTVGVPLERQYTCRTVEMYGKCDECGQIYASKIIRRSDKGYSNRVLLDEPLDDYPGVSENW